MDWWRLSWALLAPLLIGALMAIALAACAKYIPSPTPMAGQNGVDGAMRNYLWFCVPIIWSVLLLGATVLTGLLSAIQQEEEREWWARAGGLMMWFLFGWIALIGIAFYGGSLLNALWIGVLTAIGLASGYAGSLAGLSAATSSELKKVKLDQLTTAQRWLSKHDLIAPTACAIAVVCLALALAALTCGLRDRVGAQLSVAPADRTVEPPKGPSRAASADSSATPAAKPRQQVPEPTATLKTHVLANAVVMLISLVVALLANAFVNVNTFSLHGMYRMRLVRAYLGASNFARHPDDFTNFDKYDNIYEADVVRHHAPLHIINTALNLVSTTNLAWQQRKAESFTFSPISVGSWRLGYLPTSMYGGSKGVRLGTALAISGAAFNPNMGYISSPLVTLLMTFFNARLGWWLPNPIWPVLQAEEQNRGKANSATSRYALDSILTPRVANFLRRAGPTWALPPLINEALGNTNDRYKWIELTDGGHFENLGLYEMVLRRCKFIILVDADADNDFEFEDLGNAFRKIEIDLGVPIRFPNYPTGLPMKQGIDGSNVYCALGDILYYCVDRNQNSPGTKEEQAFYNGKLLYIKPCLNGGEPLGVRAYANAHPKFPHESTINQFFNEAQFESYRNLGSWEFASIVGEFPPNPKPPGDDIQTLFDRVREISEPADKRNAGLYGILKNAVGLFKKEGDSKAAARPTDTGASPNG